MMDLDAFKKLVQASRTEIISPYDLIFQEFEKLGIPNMSRTYIQQNVSSLIEQIRINAWNAFKPIEKDFSVALLKSVVALDDPTNITEAVGLEAIGQFVEEYTDHIYQLSLSNTNSRRSRAGKEFEAILELLLMACNVSMDSQGNIGKEAFTSKGLGKMVDIVTPSATHFTIDKYNTILISAKTTLRERWQEVSEENNRTAATSMYLATLEDNITKDVIARLNQAGVRLVVPLKMKETTYAKFSSVVSYETLFNEILSKDTQWNTYSYQKSQIDDIKNRLERQSEKHSEHQFVKDYYIKQLNRY